MLDLDCLFVLDSIMHRHSLLVYRIDVRLMVEQCCIKNAVIQVFKDKKWLL